MFTNTSQPSRTPGRKARTTAVRVILVCAAAQASVALLLTTPAEARVETPQDTRGAVVHSQVTPTRIAGLWGVHVDGGWLLR